MPKVKVGEDALQTRLDMVRKLVAQPIPYLPISDPEPALIGGCVLVGNKYHAANVEQLGRLGVTAVLNCASSGISKLPLGEFETRGIRYAFTNVQDHHQYPILHDKDGVRSKHLEVAYELYTGIEEAGGKVLFFCIAGQNRSAALAIACLMLRGQPLEDILKTCSKCRPFILENVGFQQQLVEMEALLGEQLNRAHGVAEKRPRTCGDYSTGHLVQALVDLFNVEIELLVPGLCAMEVKIPTKSTIHSVKEILVNHVNRHFLAYFEKPMHVAKSWVVLAMFGYDDKFDLPLEEEAIALSVQVARMRSMFGLTVVEDGARSIVHWNSKCRFALVIFSVVTDEQHPVQLPWVFTHTERPGAPATLLENTLRSTHLRAWDFETGQAHCSTEPIVFSFGEGPNDKRAFMNISRSNQAPQQFNAPGEGGILGMGSNAIVHRVELRPTSSKKGTRDMVEGAAKQNLDAAVKRSFSLSKMVASLESKSEAGMAKRLRRANALNKHGRVLYFYGLGVALSSNSRNHEEYKFESVLLSRYQEEFSSYTMKKFMTDYTTLPLHAPQDVRGAIQKMQTDFSLIKVKELLVSLLSAFRDLTLMGVQAFDFNHLNNVLISRDCRMVHLIDIDGNSTGSIQIPWEHVNGKPHDRPFAQPALDVDLHTLLPSVVQQLILGKGRGSLFVTDKLRDIWQSRTDEGAKAIIKDVIRENFYPLAVPGAEDSVDKHIFKVTEWFYALLKKQFPWSDWTNDIYDAMRCIDHLPIT